MVWTCTARPRKGQDAKLATFLIDLSPSDMQRRLGDALAVYVDAMRYPRGTEDQRASMWLEHTRRVGWKAVAAVEAPDRPRRSADFGTDLAAAPMLGVAYGYCGAPDQWWQQQVVAGLHRVGADRRADRRADDELLRADRAAHPAPRPGPRPRRGPGPPAARRTAANRTCCCRRRRSTARPTGHGGCTGGSASPTSSAATTSRATRGPSRSSGRALPL